MATDNPSNPTEAESLYQYLGERIANGGRDLSAADLIADFDEYCQQLQALRAKLGEAEDSLDRGEAGPLDLNALLQRVEQRWDEKGIAE